MFSPGDTAGDGGFKRNGGNVSNGPSGGIAVFRFPPVVINNHYPMNMVGITTNASNLTLRALLIISNQHCTARISVGDRCILPFIIFPNNDKIIGTELESRKIDQLVTLFKIFRLIFLKCTNFLLITDSEFISL